MGRFDDAIARGAATDAAPTSGLVRREHAKVGVGLSIEQKAGDNLGLFARLNWSDDKTETYAFTEVGRSVSFGACSRARRGAVRTMCWALPLR
ncbi:hypothetical protein GCM10023063_49850 [Arthrobacter methylotrophus]